MMLLMFKRFRSRTHKQHLNSHSIKRQLVRLLMLLGAILALHTVAMVYFEQLSVMDAFWLTMTSATTVGYGDLSAATTSGRLTTVFLLYIAGIAILAQTASMYFEYRQEIKLLALKGECCWTMDNHIVFLNCSEELSDEYFYRAISQLRSSHIKLASTPIIIVSQHFKEGLSERLRALDVVHVNKPVSDNCFFEAASVIDAAVVIVLSQRQLDATSDSMNFELIDRVREHGFKGRLLAEAVNDENRARLIKAGANNVLRPIRSYPELLTRAILAPGSEQVIETLFNSHGEECIRYCVDFSGTWLTVIRRLTEADVGTPIAYENQQGTVINSPSVKNTVDTKAIFLIARAENIKSTEEIVEILRH